MIGITHHPLAISLAVQIRCSIQHTRKKERWTVQAVTNKYTIDFRLYYIQYQNEAWRRQARLPLYLLPFPPLPTSGLRARLAYRPRSSGLRWVRLPSQMLKPVAFHGTADSSTSFYRCFLHISHEISETGFRRCIEMHAEFTAMRFFDCGSTPPHTPQN